MMMMMMSSAMSALLSTLLYISFASYSSGEWVHASDPDSERKLHFTTTTITTLSSFDNNNNNNNNNNLLSGFNTTQHDSGSRNNNNIGNDGFGVKVIRDENGECDFFPEVLLVQDVSTSYDEDLKNLQERMPALFDYFEEKYQGRVKFGIVSFTDINVPGLGIEDDECSYIDLPLAAVNTATAMDTARKVFAGLIAGGGGDWLEGSNVAMLRAALSKKVGWSSATHDLESGRPIVRIMITATDAAIHDPVYHAEQAGVTLKPNDLINRPSALDKDINAECNTLDYPYAEDIRKALINKAIIPVIFAGKPYWVPKPGVHQLYGEWVNFMKYRNATDRWGDKEEGLAAFYKDYLKEELRLDGVVENINMASTNFVELIEKALEQVSDAVCLSPPTPAPTTTTTPTTTTPTTTTPTTTTPTTTTPTTTTTTPTTTTPTTTTPTTTTPTTTTPTTTTPTTTTPTTTTPTTTTPTTTTPTTTTPTTTTTTTTPTTTKTTTPTTTTTTPPTTTPTTSTPSTTTSRQSRTTTSTPTTSTMTTPSTTTPSTSTPATPSSVASTATPSMTSPSSATDAPATTEAPGATDAPAITEAPEKPSTQSSEAPEGTTTDDDSENGGAGVGVIIGGAAAGAAVLAGAVMAGMKGLGAFGNAPAVDDVIQDLDNVERPEEREQFENVTAEFFA